MFLILVLVDAATLHLECLHRYGSMPTRSRLIGCGYIHYSPRITVLAAERLGYPRSRVDNASFNSGNLREPMPNQPGAIY